MFFELEFLAVLVLVLVLALGVVGEVFAFPEGVFGMEGMPPFRRRRFDSVRGSEEAGSWRGERGYDRW